MGRAIRKRLSKTQYRQMQREKAKRIRELGRRRKELIATGEYEPKQSDNEQFDINEDIPVSQNDVSPQNTTVGVGLGDEPTEVVSIVNKESTPSRSPSQEKRRRRVQTRVPENTKQSLDKYERRKIRRRLDKRVLERTILGAQTRALNKAKRTILTRVIRCSVDLCNNNKVDNPELSFFPEPLQSERRAIWLQNIKMVHDETDTRGVVCEKHFLKSFIITNKRRRRLSKFAVPTQLLPTHGSIEQASIKTELDMTFDRVEIKQELETITFYVKNPDEEDDQEDDSKNGQEKSHVRNQMESQVIASHAATVDKLSQKQKYSSKFKILALALYIKHPHSYRVLYSTFNLPRVTTLYRMYIPSSTQCNQHLLEGLQLKVQEMSKLQKQCVVSVASIKLKPQVHYDANKDLFYGFQDLNGIQTLKPASFALIIMVRGLFHNWKQAVAVSFLSHHQDSENIKYFIFQIIGELFKIGLEVRAYMSDLKTDTLTGTRTNISSKEPYFIVNGRNIYYMHDPLYMLKDIRDVLLTDTIIYNASEVRWRHFRECYQRDSRYRYMRLAPKLTDDHFKCIRKKNIENITNNDELRHEKNLIEELTLVTDVFSLTTARAMAAYLETNTLSDVKNTLDFIVTIAKLMDMLNFSVKHPPETKNAVFTGDQQQIDFLVDMLSVFYKLRLIRDIDKMCPVFLSEKGTFIEGFRLTINSLMLLHGDLSKEQCWHPIVGLTRDCFHDYFNKVNEKYGLKPTTQQIISSISSFPIFNVFNFSPRKQPTKSAKEFIVEAKLMDNIERYEKVIEYIDIICAEETKQFNTMNLPSERKSQFISLYLLNKANQVHSECVHMKKYMTPDESEAVVAHVVANIGFVVPHKFVLFVKTLEQHFKYYFKKDTTTCYRLSDLLRLVESVTFEMPCECFPLHYIKHLYMRYRVHLLLTCNQQLFSEMDDYRVQFVVNDL